MEPSETQIDELRKAFLEELSTKGENVVHPKDLQRIKGKDDWLCRFLKHNDLKLKESLDMLWTCVTWRNEFVANEINETNLKMDIIIQGGFFPRGKDVDGSLIFIFKCKKYVKGSQSMDDLKTCLIYWFDRMEREGNGAPITVFFDMEGCGLSNMDLDFTRYLIGLFKEYYPYYLNYILIFEMPWVLTAAFKIIKSWLPEKAVKKIKFVSKKDIHQFVPLDQALTCWGGQDDYSFSFIPEDVPESADEPSDIQINNNNNNKKVHFSDGTPMSDSTTDVFSNVEKEDDVVRVQPSLITFSKEDFTGTLELENVSAVHIAYKVKTTSPEKFKVRPSTGSIAPGAKTTVSMELLPGYKASNLAKDKFLILTTTIDNPELLAHEITNLWKTVSPKKARQVHIRCAPLNIRNGSAVPTPGSGATAEVDQVQLNKISSSIRELQSYQSEVNQTLKQIQYFQIGTIVILILAVAFLYAINSKTSDDSLNYCKIPHIPAP